MLLNRKLKKEIKLLKSDLKALKNKSFERSIELGRVITERDQLFIVLGKYADIPSYEYWKERFEKCERDRNSYREIK